MIEHIINKLKWRKNIIISGGAGVGKSYTLHKIVSSNKFSSVQVLAPTALAAVAVGGRTVHSFFRFRLASSLETLRMKSSERAELIRDLDEIEVLIIDEISMLSADLFDMIDHFLSILKTPPTLLLVGDFYQLAPISKNKDQIADYAFCSKNWAKYDFEVLLLDKQYRVLDEVFYRELSKLRVGNTDAECAEYFSRFLTPLNPGALNDYTIICGTNAEANSINEIQLAHQPGELYELNLQISHTSKSAPSRAFLASMLAQTPLENNLFFKLQSRVIVTMNIPGSSAYNGMQARVHSFSAKTQEISLVLDNQEIIKLKPSVFEFDENGEYIDGMSEAEPVYKISGFALKLGYAITIHKSQGMSIAKLVCKCDRIFAAGQLYVAFSRASDVNNFKIAYANNKNSFVNLLYSKTRPNFKVAEFYANCKRFNFDSIL